MADKTTDKTADKHGDKPHKAPVSERPNLKFDKRVIERSIKSGHMTHADYENRMKALHDNAANADNIAPQIYGEG